MIDWANCSAVENNQEILSGAWVFKGTRIPVSSLFTNLEDGATTEEFVQWFPGLTMEQVDSVLEHVALSAAPA